MRRIVFILIVLLLTSITVACGQKGALKLPQDAPVPAPKQSDAGVKK
jgi:predicted small lipoprotein YifL